MGEALLINPMDENEMAEALEAALTMPHDVQQKKMRLMQKRLRDYDVLNWVNDFLIQLNDVKSDQEAQHTKFLTGEAQQVIVKDYRQAGTRSLLLDYDGTLVPFARHPREAQPGANCCNS
ncbi:MAG: hypothetical protein HC859_10850 [Bacteroidia bacterium]|nr:hypothetical protein [Bacteroidia bacterium]